MFPCVACHRHLRSSESSCPFCGAEQHSLGAPAPRVTALLFAASLAVLGSVGCSTQGGSQGEGTTRDEDPGTTTMPPTGATDTATVTDSAAPTSTETGEMGSTLTFVPGVDIAAYGSPPCSPLEQWGCPEGEKCVPFPGGHEQDHPQYPYGEDKCVPIIGEGMSGDPCVLSSYLEGQDDCDEDNLCYQIQAVEGALEGVCTPYCSGTPDDPLCAEGSTCYLDYDGSLAVCLADCSPFEPMCPEGQNCGWNGWSAFGCAVGPAEPTLGQLCDRHIDSCAAREICVGAEQLPSCAGDNCCTELCELEGAPCSEPMLSCEPLFEPEFAPAGLETVGLCVEQP